MTTPKTRREVHLNGTRAPPTVPAEAVEGFINAFQTFLDYPLAKMLPALLREHREATCTNSRNLKTIVEVQTENDDLRKAEDKRLADISQANKRIKQLEEELVRCKTAISKKEKEFREQNEKLKLLESFAIPAIPKEENETSKHLHKISASAYTIVKNCFSQDLERGVLEGASWKKFRKAFTKVPLPLADIPLPPTNTADAKRMRTTAVLGYLALVAMRELFQPAYVLPGGPEIGELLEATHNGDQANWLRRVLLHTDIERQKSNAEQRAATVAAAVSDLTSSVLAPDKQRTFIAALNIWCTDTAETWQSHVQPLTENIVVFLQPDGEEDPADWATPEWLSVNGVAAQELQSMDDIVVNVWPVFMTSSSMHILHKGLAIAEAQIQTAKEEDKQLAALADSGRRNYRATTRRQSVTFTNGSDTGRNSRGFPRPVSPTASTRGEDAGPAETNGNRKMSA